MICEYYGLVCGKETVGEYFENIRVIILVLQDDSKYLKQIYYTVIIRSGCQYIFTI